MYEEIQQQITEVLKYNIPDLANCDISAQVADSVRVWAKNKKHIIDAFGGKLIYEVPNTYSAKLSNEVKLENVSDLCYWFEENYSSEPNCIEVADFIYCMGEYIYANKVPFDYGFYDNVKDTETLIKQGTKVTRALKYFSIDSKALIALQNKISIMHQEETVTGTLCFSVHPLDFLSASDNTYNWTSCHSWTEDRAMGQFSYMLDTSTFICYLRGANNVKLPVFPSSVSWNSKKWRVLLHTNLLHSLFLMGRHYPFPIPDVNKEIAKYISKLFGVRNLSPWQIEKEITTKRNEVIGKYFNIFNETFLKDSLVTSHPDSLAYNDLRFFTVARTTMCYDTNCYQIQPLFVGNKVPCFKCGKHNIINPGSGLCDRCSCEPAHNHHCVLCGESLRYGTNLHLYQINRYSVAFICDNCFKKEVQHGN